MSETKVRKAIFKALHDVGLNLPEVHENVEPDIGEAPIWIRVTYIPNEPTPVTLGVQGEDDMEGVLQIDLNIDSGKGSGDLFPLVDQLRNHFTAGRIFAYDGQEVTIRSCGRSVGRTVDSYYRIPVSVIWYSRIQRNLIP